MVLTMSSVASAISWIRELSSGSSKFAFAIISWSCSLFLSITLVLSFLSRNLQMSSPPLLDVCPFPTGWHCFFHHLKYFQILIFFDLWHLNGKSDKEVTVYTFACLSMCNTVIVIFATWGHSWDIKIWTRLLNSTTFTVKWVIISQLVA